MTVSTSPASDPLFPPLQKGGWGGFAFALSGEAEAPQQQEQQQKQKQKQKQIPRVRCAAAAPFFKGGNSELPQAKEHSQLHMMTASAAHDGCAHITCQRSACPPFAKGGLGGIRFCFERQDERSVTTKAKAKAKANPPRPLRGRRPLLQRGQKLRAPGLGWRPLMSKRNDHSGCSFARVEMRSQPQPQPSSPSSATPQTPSPDPHRRETPSAPSRRMQRKPS
ncbi:hypothetical protein LC55x_2550 [Lysobacter capsici]|uniref:hypothetical protein n=1 Tax=Lysobacter capsici TaxID=435897 RepID=UPI00071F4D49|nr:hypothetical protein [Lysobacter capsici]ALN85815.1 hypothetical protein LC55x_2550 [Lysobacter capsici]